MNSETACPGCGARAEAGQEYCLECGARFSETRRPLHWAWPVLAAALIAAGGAAVAIAAGGDESHPATIVALTTLRPSSASDHSRRGAKLRLWPRRNGYTVVLAVIPVAAGPGPARARALAAVNAGLPDVGVLASARYASLHPGYSVVFSGVYETLDEALAALPRAARYARNAYAQQITR